MGPAKPFEPLSQPTPLRRFSIRRLLLDLPIPWKLALIILLFSIVICGLLAMSFAGFEILSGARAYAGGEGLYSKAEKSAIYRLTRYALLREEADYQHYRMNMAIPLGDHDALLELSKPRLDKAAIARAFIQGRNHPADVTILTFMAHRLARFPYMNRAIAIWAQADALVQELNQVGEELHTQIISGHATPATIDALLRKINAIDERLTPLEDDFSYTLGEGGRWLKGLLLALMALSTGCFLAAALAVAYFIARHLCGEIRQLRSTAARIAGGDYSVPVQVDSRDEIGDLAQSFQEMAAQRQQAERLKDEFFANVSHELRTPLTLILSPLESLLSDTGRLDAKERRLLETMHNNAMRLLQLVNGLLDFSKLDAGRIVVERSPVQIMALSRMVFQDFQPLMKERHLQSQLEVEPPEAVVRMDRHLYERILFNLLSNAVKFTPPGGRVVVRVQWADGQLRLVVSDSGIGIPAEEQAHIFQRFRQVEGSSTRRFEGTGLGLALVKEFAQLLGGHVVVESELDHGSTFTVTCEAAATPAAGAPALVPSPARLRAQRYAIASSQADPTSPDASRPKVLVAEDNAEMASHIAGLLAPFCQVQIARDGYEALALVRRWSPDLALTDVMMPGRDGLSLCRDIRANAATAAIPVVMITALTHREALLEGWKAGASDYLFKPFHPVELVTRVQSLLKARLDQQRAEQEIRHLNENLRHRALELQVSNRELEAFSYSVSHDLRTPLRAIEGFSRELLDDQHLHLNEQSRHDLERIRAATDRMSQLIDGLLLLSRLTRQELKRETVELSAVAHRIVDDLRNASPGRSVAVEIAPRLVSEGDAQLLSIVLENLLQNAWKFTSKHPAAHIELGSFERDGQTVFFVRDNGAGFNMAFADKLFGPFQRLHHAKEFPGHGVGLALVQRIVHRHGGEVWGDSQENQGATFYFTLSSKSGVASERISV